MPRHQHEPSNGVAPALAIRRAHWDRRAVTFDADFSQAPIRTRVLDEIFRHLPRGRYKALDAGTGSGRTLARLLKHVDPDSELVGTDISSAMLDEARTRISLNRPMSLSLVNADNANLPFSAGEFDIVLSTFTLHHIPLAQQFKVLREFRRVLKDGGTLALADQVMPDPAFSGDEMRKEIASVFYPHLATAAAFEKLPDYGEWPIQPARFKELLHDAGFDVEITLLEPIVAVIRGRAGIDSHV